jgi:hypothetical protein
MGDPFKSVKLGDEMGRVLLRYGQPDEIVYFNPVNLQIVLTGVTVYAARADFDGVFAVGHPYRHRRHRCLDSVWARVK